MTTTLRRESARWVEPVGRVGLATQGVLYAVVGLLALQIADGHTTDRADQHGVIDTLVAQTFGHVLLLVLTIGLALHCAWRLLLSYRGDPGEDDAKEWVKRAGHFGRALIYAGLTIAAARVLIEAKRHAGDEHRVAASKALEWPGGQLLLTVVGVVMIGTGLWHASKLVTRSFVDHVDLDSRHDAEKKVITALGSIGYLARGVVYGLVGWFFVQAAIERDPNESGGLDNALRRLAASENGPNMLRLLAAGLFIFGVYRIVDSFVHNRDALSYA